MMTGASLDVNAAPFVMDVGQAHVADNLLLTGASDRLADPFPNDLLRNLFEAKETSQVLHAANVIADHLFLSPSSASSSDHGLKEERLVNGASKSTPCQYLPGVESLFDSLLAAANSTTSGLDRESSMIAYGTLCQKASSFKQNHPHLILPWVLKALPRALELHTGDKGKPVQEAAQRFVSLLLDALPSTAVRSHVFPTCFQALAASKWQTRMAALSVLGLLPDRFPSVVASSLPLLIPHVTECMHSTKLAVAKAASQTMLSLVTVVGNGDIEPHLPALVACMAHPEEVDSCIEKVSRTTFVAQVTPPALAVMVPLLVRALQHGRASTGGGGMTTVRRTVVIIANLCKMIPQGTQASLFVPDLAPGLVQLVTHAAFPEIRALASEALQCLLQAAGLMESEDERMSSLLERSDEKELMQVLRLDRLSLSETNIASSSPSAPPATPSADVVAQVSDVTRSTLAKSGLSIQSSLFKVFLLYVSVVLGDLCGHRSFHKKEWHSVLSLLPFVFDGIPAEVLTSAVYNHFHDLDRALHPEGGADEDEEDAFDLVPPGAHVLCDCEFSLAYGGMLLLNHTRLKLVRGRRYGLCGANGAGKSTLMRSISLGKLEGFPGPDVVKTAFVEHALQGEDTSLGVVDFVCTDARLTGPKAEGGMGVTRQNVEKALSDVGFTPQLLALPVGGLSGGWKMKLELARAMLLNADILLLDEPTNHLDVTNVAWLQEYLISQKDLTCLIVSHDSGFLDTVCTDIIHYESKKLVRYVGNLSAFVKRRPEAKSYYSLSSTNVKFVFPKPSPLTGVRSNTRTILKMSSVHYTYPGASFKSCTDLSANISLSSRIGIVGKNGAGKSTLIKLMTGELIPDEGSVWKHPNLRIGYVAQYAFHHLEEHAKETPFKYLMWRYQGGEDREVLLKETRKFTEADLQQMQTPVLVDGAPRRIEMIFGRQKLKKTFHYEIKWVGHPHKRNTWMTREALLELGFQKLVQSFDDYESSREGLGYRQLNQDAIRQHYQDVGLDPLIAEHNALESLSGGQKVKVVIAGCMWNNPHVLVLDEPTNFLDRDSLGGLAVAIRDWAGAVIIISHNDEFVRALCPEFWRVEAGVVTKCGVSGGIDASLFEDSNMGENGNGAKDAPSPASVNGTVVRVASQVDRKDDKKNDAADHDDETELLKKIQKSKKSKKKKTRNELKAQEARRRERKLRWLQEGGELILNSDEEE